MSLWMNLLTLITDIRLKMTNGLGLGLPIGFKSGTYTGYVLYNYIDFLRDLTRPHESNMPYNFVGNRFMVVTTTTQWQPLQEMVQKWAKC